MAATTAPRAPRPHLRRLLAWLHLWVGLGVGVAFAAVGLSGSVLVFQNELLRLQHPQLAAHAPVADGTVLAAILSDPASRGLRSIDLPRPALPVWQGYFADGSRRYFAPEDGALLLARSVDNDWLLWLRDLHVRLLAGEAGEQALGIVGIAGLFLLASGLYLWWPRIGHLRMHLRMHAGPPLRRWLSWHRSAGALTLPLLALLTLTGVAMIYHDASRAVLTGVFGGDAIATPAVSREPRVDLVDWARVLAVAQHALPDAVLVRLTPPAAGSGTVVLRARRPAEWHPNGRSTLQVAGADARLLRASDATAQPLGARIDHAIYPLHGGMVGGLSYRLAVAIAGLLPAFLLVTGFLFWRRRTSQDMVRLPPHGVAVPRARTIRGPTG